MGIYPAWWHNTMSPWVDSPYSSHASDRRYEYAMNTCKEWLWNRNNIHLQYWQYIDNMDHAHLFIHIQKIHKKKNIYPWWFVIKLSSSHLSSLHISRGGSHPDQHPVAGIRRHSPAGLPSSSGSHQRSWWQRSPWICWGDTTRHDKSHWMFQVSLPGRSDLFWWKLRKKCKRMILETSVLSQGVVHSIWNGKPTVGTTPEVGLVGVD